MAYISGNPKTKKALVALLESGERPTVYQPGGLFPLTPDVVRGDKGYTVAEGPHYPDAHRWYAAIEYDLNTKHLTRVLTNAEQRKIYRG